MQVDENTDSKHPGKAPIPASDLDFALTVQIVIAWAGEAGEQRRLGWWRSDLMSEFGGEDLFKRLLPHSWGWGVMQGAREAARRRDAELRARDHDPDQIVSLFNLGFELDERLAERLQDLKSLHGDPSDALTGLKEGISGTWNRDTFLKWAGANGSVETKTVPAGRLIPGPVPASLQATMRQLVAALAAPSDEYPLPHFRRGK